MKPLGFDRIALGATVAAASLASCGGSQPPVAPPGLVSQASRIAKHPGDLIYVGDSDVYAYILAYPSGKYVKRITLPNQDPEAYFCSDARGDVFIPTNSVTNSGVSHLFEYAHGATTPKATLTIDGLNATSCAVNPQNGNLAVAGWAGKPSSPTSNLAIFKDAQGQPRFYGDPNLREFSSCSYDGKSDLFVGGGVSGTPIAELPAGGSSFVEISLPAGSGGDVQWDGAYLAITNAYRHQNLNFTKSRILRVEVSGSSGTIVGDAKLETQRHYLNQTWIEGSMVISPPQDWEDKATIAMWHYPHGGAPYRIKPIPDARYTSGVTISLARRSM